MDAIFARFLLSPILNYANSSWINNYPGLMMITILKILTLSLETWNTKLTPNVDNNLCPLLGQYNIIFNKHS